MSSKQSRRQFLAQAGLAAASASTFNILSRRAYGDATRPPNILLFFPDQHRPDWSSLTAGLAVRTPNFARLAQSGVRFTQAICPTPLCAPSRACLALGREYDNTGVPTNNDNIADGEVTFYARLREAGYRVGGVGKFDMRKGASDWGIDGRHWVNGKSYFDEWGFTDGLDSEGKGATLVKIVNKDDPPNARGESPYSKMLTDRKDGTLQRYLEWNRACRKAYNQWSYTEPMDIADEAYNDNWVGNNGLECIKNYPTGKPWFLQVNFPGPHPPVDITTSMAEWYRDASFPGPHASDELPPEKQTEIRRNYSAMVENIDKWLGRYYAEIEKRGELDNTIIVWSSDHGEMLGDHERWGKSVPFHPSLSVPLLVSGPGIQRGVTLNGPTTTLDLTATFLDFAGAPQLDKTDSQSLRAILEGKTATGRPHVTAGLGSWRTVFDGRYKYISGFDMNKSKKGSGYATDTASASAPPILFDLATDPLEDHNIAEANPDIVARLAALAPKAAVKSA